MTRILKWALMNRLTVIAFFAAGSALGLYAVTVTPVDAVPDITPVQVMVNAMTGALDPEQIEKTVTFPIETEMSGIARVKDVRSLSKYGLSQVVVVFEDGTDIYWARQQVAERLQGAKGEIPPGVSPELAPISTGLGEVVMYTVLAKPGTPLAAKPKTERLLYLRTIHDFVVVPYLKRAVKNVADVDSTGGYKKEIHIELHPDKLDKLGVTIEQIAQRLEGLGENSGGGYIQPKGRQIIVRTSGRLRSLEEIRGVAIKLDVRGKPVPLSAVADVREDFSQRMGGATSAGEETVLGIVLMLSGANSRQVSIDVEQALKDAPLPPDVTLELVYTRSYLVDATLKTVMKNLAEGAALVVVVLLVILGNLRAALFVTLAIPLSMLFGAIGMKWFGVSASLMSLGAIDFGLLVDGAVVMIENTLRRLEEHEGELGPSQRMDLFLNAAAEVVQPVTIGLLIHHAGLRAHPVAGGRRGQALPPHGGHGAHGPGSVSARGGPLDARPGFPVPQGPGGTCRRQEGIVLLRRASPDIRARARLEPAPLVVRPRSRGRPVRRDFGGLLAHGIGLHAASRRGRPRDQLHALRRYRRGRLA